MLEPLGTEVKNCLKYFSYYQSLDCRKNVKFGFICIMNIQNSAGKQLHLTIFVLVILTLLLRSGNINAGCTECEQNLLLQQ